MDSHFDLDILSQQLQVGDVIEIRIIDGDLCPGQKIKISIASKQITKYHLVLFFQHHMQSLNLAEVEGEPISKSLVLVIDHMEIIDPSRGYLAIYNEEMIWSNQLVTWMKIGRSSASN